MYYFYFKKDKRGFGRLQLISSFNDKAAGMVQMEYAVRTGSIDKSGQLVNALPSGTYWITVAPVDTAEEGMFITHTLGWKVRLYNHFKKFTHYLIHPDGGKVINNGTKGCIGIQNTDARELKVQIEQIMAKNKEIKVIVEG